MVKLRLKRMGRKNRPFYRVSVMDARTKRDGSVIEPLGYYDPIEKDTAKAVKVNLERAKYWLSVGAQPSPTVQSILRKMGVTFAEKKVSRKPQAKKPRKKAEGA